MPTQNKSNSNSEAEILRTARKGNNKKIYIAIVVVVIFTVVAMTGVLYEYW